VSKVYAPFQVSPEDVARSSTMTARDCGKWALLVAGCYHLFETRLAAQQCRQKLNAP